MPVTPQGTDCQCSRVLIRVPTGHADRGPNARHAPRLPLSCFCRGRSVNAALWASLPFHAFSFHSGITENIGTTHICLQTSGCALSCGGTNTFWFTGACIPTGNRRTDARRRAKNTRSTTAVDSCLLFAPTVTTVGCPRATWREKSKSRHTRKSRGGLVQQHTHTKKT